MKRIIMQGGPHDGRVFYGNSEDGDRLYFPGPEDWDDVKEAAYDGREVRVPRHIYEMAGETGSYLGVDRPEDEGGA